MDVSTWSGVPFDKQDYVFLVQVLQERKATTELLHCDLATPAGYCQGCCVRPLKVLELILEDNATGLDEKSDAM
jgi:hypothetical protein